MEIRMVLSEDRAWNISFMQEKLWPLARSAAQKRILTFEIIIKKP